MGMVAVGSYIDVTQAQLDRCRLEGSGIDCFLTNEAVGGLQILGISAIDPMKLMVLAEDERAAREVLAEPGEGEGT